MMAWLFQSLIHEGENSTKDAKRVVKKDAKKLFQSLIHEGENSTKKKLKKK